MNPLPCTRRAFCRKAGGAVAALGALPLLNAGRAEAVPLLSPIVLDLTDITYAALATVNGAMYVTHPQDAMPIIVVRTSADSVAAFSSRCTHFGCQVSLPSSGTVVCPCHGSRFDTAGHVTFGPAMQNLEPFVATLSENVITIANNANAVERSSTLPGAEPFQVRQDGGRVLVIASDRSLSWSMEIFGADGKKLTTMRSRGTETLIWDNPGRASGTYFIKIHFSGRSILRKITILK